MPDPAPLVAPCPRCQAVSWYGLLCWRCDRVPVIVREGDTERVVWVPRVRTPR